VRRIKTCGKAPGILTGDVKLAQHYIELGCLFTALGSDLGILLNGAEQLAATFKSQPRPLMRPRRPGLLRSSLERGGGVTLRDVL
jgi:hypothetical protein